MNKFEKLQSEFNKGGIKPTEYQELLHKLLVTYIKQEQAVFAKKTKLERTGMISDIQKHKNDLKRFSKLITAAGNVILDINRTLT